MFGSVNLQDLLDRGEILQRFRHFQTVNMKMTGVPEMVDPVVAFIVSFGLRKLVVMMREFKIDTT